MELQGVIKVIGETKAYGKNDFLKRELVVTTSEQYPQDIMIEFTQDKCVILDKYAEGQEVTVGVNLRGKEWTSPKGEVKYFNTLNGWKINLTDGSKPATQTPAPQPKEKSANEPQLPVDEEEDDGLPF